MHHLARNWLDVPEASCEKTTRDERSCKPLMAPLKIQYKSRSQIALVISKERKKKNAERMPKYIFCSLRWKLKLIRNAAHWCPIISYRLGPSFLVCQQGFCYVTWRWRYNTEAHSLFFWASNQNAGGENIFSRGVSINTLIAIRLNTRHNELIFLIAF